jgi:hypothetical protein
MGTTFETQPAVREAIEEAVRIAREAGFAFEPQAKERLSELIDMGFRELTTSRVLDRAGPERERALGRARTSLDDFLRLWMSIEARNGSETLTTPGFERAQSEHCPVYPFK